MDKDCHVDKLSSESKAQEYDWLPGDNIQEKLNNFRERIETVKDACDDSVKFELNLYKVKLDAVIKAFGLFPINAASDSDLWESSPLTYKKSKTQHPYKKGQSLRSAVSDEIQYVFKHYLSIKLIILCQEGQECSDREEMQQIQEIILQTLDLMKFEDKHIPLSEFTVTEEDRQKFIEMFGSVENYLSIYKEEE